MSTLRSRLLSVALCAASGSLWALPTGPACDLAANFACYADTGPVSNACRAIGSAIGLACATGQNPGDALRYALMGTLGYPAKCVTSGPGNVTSGSQTSTSDKGYSVSASATVCLNPTAAGPAMVFVCTASTGAASANSHVDCGPAPVAGDVRYPVPGYGADTNNPYIFGLMAGRKVLNVRYSGITAGDSIQGGFTMDLSVLTP